MDNSLIEVQVDGLPGPTHHFGGLAAGNLASQAHAGHVSHPQAAALQGLEKMRRVMALGLPQAWLPPLPRPDLDYLRHSGLSGDDASVLTAAAQQPELLHRATSSAFMWSANCATVIPESDSRDGRCHIVLANLSAMAHRRGEGRQRAPQWRRLCAHIPAIVIHDPLPESAEFGDEGAANHSRIYCDGQVTHLFIHGRMSQQPAPTHFPARQTREASVAVAQLGNLSQERIVHIQQLPQAINAGAFHNDVVMVGSDEHILIHESAWSNQADTLRQLRQRHPSLQIAEITNTELSLADAVTSYLFNSQLLQTKNGLILLYPQQAQHGRAGQVIKRLCAEGFLAGALSIDLHESMANGGGPACLRLRLPLSQHSYAALPTHFLVNQPLLEQLENIIKRHYREVLKPEDLSDLALLRESQAADRAFIQLLFS